MARKAIVAYSFGGSPVHGPGRANVKLAEVAARIFRETRALLVVQDYLGAPLRDAGLAPDLVIREHRQKGQFLGTEEVTSQAAEYLRSRGITQVLLVAHSFLHWKKCLKLLQGEGLSIERVRTGWVPFDSCCESWWVRGPFHLLLYGVLQAVFGRQGR